jgi:iron complex outermembrane receptor protein
MKKLFLFFLGLFVLHNAWCQVKIRMQLSGKVTDAKTGESLAGASVIIEDAKLGTVTDSSGNFLFKNVPAGHHLIEVSFTGYSSVLEHLDITADKELNIALVSTVVEYQAVTVTGVSTSTSIRKTPVPITIVRQAELLQTPSTNIIDALSKQAGISQVGTGPAISKPVIRGLGFNRVVVINDGIRQEGQQWGEEHGIEIDDASVNRVEVLKGPASLMYGSDALAGVINIISNVPVSEGAIKGNLLSNYQTNNRLYATHADLAGNKKGFSWNVYGSLRNAGDYKNKIDGRVLNSRFNEKNYGAFFGINKNWGYSRFMWNSFNQRVGIIEGERDELTGKFLAFAESPDERIATESDLATRDPLPPFQRIMHNKFITDNNLNIGKSRLKIILGHQNNKRKEFADLEEEANDDPELFFDLNTTIYNLHWVLPEINKWRTTIGFNGMRQHNENRGKEEIIPDYSFNDAGLFIYFQGFFNKYTLSGGLRFDNRYINSKGEVDNGTPKFEAFRKNFSNLSGSIGISYEPSKTVTVKANIGRGFRAPNLAELASNGAHEGTKRWEYGSKNLKSEQSLQFDGELDVSNEHLTLGLNLFYNRINNFIFYRRLNSVFGGDSIVLDDNGEELQSFQFDQNNAQLYGFEFNLDLHPHPLDWLHFENRISFVRGRFINSIFGSDNLPQIPALRWLSELRADFKKGGKKLRNFYIMAEMDNNFKQEKAFYPYNTETATSAYTLINAATGTDVLRKNKTLFSIHFAVNNITDKAYQNHLSRLKYTAVNEVTGRQGVYSMGRNFSIKLNIPFSFTSQ